MQELIRMNQNGQLDNVQSQWFRDRKPVEELFATYLDPFELFNIADDPKYSNKLNELRNRCANWMSEINDKGTIPEEELINTFWPNKMQPKTSSPIIDKVGDSLIVTCHTEGANIGYKYYGKDMEPWKGWRPYLNPIRIEEGMHIEFRAHRLGYSVSEKVIYLDES